MTSSQTSPDLGPEAPAFLRHGLHYQPTLRRNRFNLFFNILAGSFAAIAVLPLILVLAYVLIKGGALIRPSLFFELPPAPGSTGGGIGNALLGTLIITLMASLLSIPVGVGGGIYLAEYSSGGWFSRFVRFGNDVLAGVPSIISGVFVYGSIVATRVFFGQSYSALAGAMALAVLMLPTLIKTTDEGLRLVPNDLRLGSYGVGASRFVTITRITLPSAFTPIATGSVLAIARAAGETAPLIFTALFSPFWPESIFNPMATMSVLIFNFAIMPYEPQNELAWAASFVLVFMILLANLFSRWLANLRKT
ncbi:MAG: phosphate ABC transporter permease PstA [Cyanobacteriota bacterium]|jgi:phosphate transport system permease protein